MIIYSAKTNYRITDLTAELVSKKLTSPFERIYVFCEDKNTLSLESAIANRLGGSFNVSVTSFSRYVLSRITQNQTKCLSKVGSTLAVFDIMKKIENELHRLRINNRPSLSSDVFSLISQLKSAKVTSEKLKEICQNESGAFLSKLEDLQKIYAEYESYLEQKCLNDSGSLYDLMPSIVLGDESLKGSKVIFSGFSSITRQITDIFECVSQVCDADFVLLSGEGEFFGNEVYQRVLSLFPCAFVVKDSFEYLPEVNALISGLYNPDNFKKVGYKTDKVHVFEVASPYDEAKTIAKRIRYEVVKNNARYKDFCIATNDVSAYERIFSEIFEDYEIPLFCDIAKPIDAHPLSKLIVAFCNAVRGSLSVESALNLSRQEYVATKSQASAFERYVNKNAISRKMLLKEFEIDDENRIEAEKVRKKIKDAVDCLLKKASAIKLCEGFISIFNLLNIQEKNKQFALELERINEGALCEFTERAPEKISQIFEEIKNVVGDSEITITDFKTMFLNATKATELSILPQYNDMVYMGDFKSAKQQVAKILFVVGLTSDVPGAKQDIALLNDRELVKMEGYKCIVEPTIKIVNRRERESVCVSLLSFSKALYAFYPRVNASFQPSLKSEVVDYILSVFDIQIKNVDEARSSRLYQEDKDIFGYMTLKSALKQFAIDSNEFCERKNDVTLKIASFYELAKEQGLSLDNFLTKTDDFSINGEIVSKFSASVIEKYFSCPYACFANYALGIKQEENGEAQPFEFGNFLHSIVELFVLRLDEVKDEISCGVITDGIYEEIVKNAEYARYFNKKQYEHLFNLVKKEAKKTTLQIYKEFKNSKFVPLGVEVCFGNLPGSKKKAIELNTAYGKKYISGKVDRVDAHENFVRIIDYKTGNVEEKIKEEMLYSGKNIQLFLYSNAFLDGNKKLAGAYYYKVDDDYSQTDEERRVFFGRSINDEKVLIAHDLRLKDSNESKNFYFKLSEKDGIRKFDSRNKTAVLSDEISSYVTYAKKVAESGANSLLSGNVIPSPYEKSCQYCQYKGMCGYDEEIETRTRKVKNIDKQTIINALKENDDE